MGGCIFNVLTMSRYGLQDIQLEYNWNTLLVLCTMQALYGPENWINEYLIEEANANVHLETGVDLGCDNEDDPNNQVSAQSSIVTWITKFLFDGEWSYNFSSNWKINSKLLQVSLLWSMTALHLLRRGDMEIVELLLEYGANPSIKNDMGRRTLYVIFVRWARHSNSTSPTLLNFRYCEAFPDQERNPKDAKEKRCQQKNDEKSSKPSSKLEVLNEVKFLYRWNFLHKLTLQRRLSTATTWSTICLMNLGTMLKLFGSSSDRKKNSISVIKSSRSRKTYKIWGLTLGLIVIFVSHQWTRSIIQIRTDVKCKYS